MKKLLLVLFLAILLTACKETDTNPAMTSVDIYKGIDGLTASFLNVPSEVFEEMPLRVALQVENKGAYPSLQESDSFTGILSLSVEDDYMGLTTENWLTDDWINERQIQTLDDKRIRFQLNGKTMDNPLGEKGIIAADIEVKKIKEEQSQSHDTVIAANFCYSYQTKAVPTVCIDAVQYGLREKEKSCEIKLISLQDQGAPVAVTAIETQMLPQGKDRVVPMFMITMQNKGNGDVISLFKDNQGTVEDNTIALENSCTSSSLQTEDLNYVAVTAAMQGKYLECTPRNGIIKLKDKQGAVRCTLSEGIPQDRGTYTTPLQIVLYYGYMFSVTKNVKIKKVLTY
jgi:hypothetical protein